MNFIFQAGLTKYHEYLEEIDGCGNWKDSYKNGIKAQIRKWTLANEKFKNNKRYEELKEKFEKIHQNFMETFEDYENGCL